MSATPRCSIRYGPDDADISIELPQPADVEAALKRPAAAGAGAIVVGGDRVTFHHHKLIIETISRPGFKYCAVSVTAGEETGGAAD